MKKSGDILKDSVFWTNFDLMTPILGTKSCSKWAEIKKYEIKYYALLIFIIVQSFKWIGTL